MYLERKGKSDERCKLKHLTVIFAIHSLQLHQHEKRFSYLCCNIKDKKKEQKESKLMNYSSNKFISDMGRTCAK